MADNQRDPAIDSPQQGNDQATVDRGRTPSTAGDAEREKAGAADASDQGLDGEEDSPKRNRGAGQAVHSRRGPTDPDSAESDIDRDDTVSD